MATIFYVTSDEMADEYDTCEYCDRIKNTPNYAYHFCTGRKLFHGTKAAQQSVHLTGGSLRDSQAESTPQPDTGLKADSNPPASK